MKLIINLHNVSGCGGVGSKDVTLDEAYDNSPSGDKFITIDDGAIELNGTNVTGLVFDGTSFNQTPRTIPAVPAQDSVEVYATTETVGGVRTVQWNIQGEDGIPVILASWVYL